MSEIEKIVNVWWPEYDIDKRCWTIKVLLHNGRTVVKVFKDIDKAIVGYNLLKDLKNNSR